LPIKATLTLEIKDVPTEASIGLVALNQEDELKDKHKRLKELSKVKTTIDGMSAMIQTFTYDNLDNVMLPVWIQYIDVLQPKKLAVIQVICHSKDCYEYGPALDQVRQSFRMTPLLKNGQPDKKRLPKQNPKGSFSDLVKELEK
jgi:hypothetical protein